MTNQQEPVSHRTFSGDSHPCEVCGTTDKDKAMAFRGENYCSEIHRKVLAGQEPWPSETGAPPREVRPTRSF